MTLPGVSRITRRLVTRLNGGEAVGQVVPGVEADAAPDLAVKASRQLVESVFKPNVTVVIPTLNEAEAISQVIEEVKKEDYNNILVVDGYSTDRTDSIAFDNSVKVIYQHGIGKAGAVKTAIERVETPYVVFMDGDHTYDPKDVWRMLLHAEHYSHVIGTRDRKYIPRVHRFGNWVISQVFSVLFGVRVSDVCSGMYLLETEEVKKYRLEETGFNVEIELAAQSASRENLTEVPIDYRPRIGQKKLSTLTGFSILHAAFSLARRYNPILLYSSLTGLSVVPAAVVLSYVALEVLTKRVWHSGWALLGIMLLLVAAQAFTLASVSILTKHSERRLMEEIRSSRQ
jgi:glycosyltransferase involved in cell wall biosynthesis